MGSAEPDFSGPVEKSWGRHSERWLAGPFGGGFKRALEKRHEGFGMTIKDAIEALRIAFEEDLLSYLDLDRC
jgi:hypothetical protein